MNIELRELMDDNEMLSHIFLGCIPHDKLMAIRDKYVGETDWEKESVKIPVSMKIGGVALNPKEFFNAWKDQMQTLINKKANELVAEKIGSKKMQEFVDKLYAFEQIFLHWEEEITWNAKNPFIEDNN